MSTDALLSRPLAVAAIGAEGTLETVAASPAERAAIAAAFGLVELRVLEAQLDLSRAGAMVMLTGRLVATLVQTCVVSLVPVIQHLDRPFERRLLPAPAAGRETEAVVEPGETEPPDFYEGGRIDLGGVVLEELALSIDPYPRAPGAALAAVAEDEPEAQRSPFAALAAPREERRR